MCTSALKRLSLLIGLSVLSILVFPSTTGRGEPAMPTAAPSGVVTASGVVAAIDARQAAEEAVLAAAMRADLAAEVNAYVVQQALTTARRRSSQAGAERAEAQAEIPLSTRGRARISSVPTPKPPGTARVPILMYHHLADVPPGADPVRVDLSVGPAAFVKQLDYLRSHGYQTVSLADLAAHLQHGAPLPPRPVVLTFDDGYDDNFSQVFPILRRFGFGATFFIITDFVGQPGYATWEQLAEMSRRGMAIEAHGRTHADLAVSGAAEVAWQAAGSRSVIAEKLGRSPQFYCYPSGRYTAATISILQANGFVAAVSTTYGATHSAASLFELTRVRVRGTDTLDQFAAKVESAP